MTKTKIDKGTVYLAVDSFSAVDAEGVPFVVRKGDRLRGDDAVVQDYSAMFWPEDDPAGYKNAHAALYADAVGIGREGRQKDTPAAQITEPRVRAVRDVAVEIDGERREVKAGDLLSSNDPLAAMIPDAFSREAHVHWTGS